MTLLCLLLCIAVIATARVLSRTGNLALISPVALVGWFGLFYLVFPSLALDLGMQTRWARYVPEVQLISLAMVPFLVFGFAAITVAFVGYKLRFASQSSGTAEVFPKYQVGVALVVLSGLSFLFMVLTQRVNTSFFGEAQLIYDVDFKYLLAMVDLAIPGVAILYFSGASGRRLVPAIVVLTLLAFVLLGARYRVVMLALLVLSIVTTRARGLDLRVIGIGVGSFAIVLLMGAGRSYRQGFDMHSALSSSFSELADRLLNEANIQIAMGAVVDFVPRLRGYDFWAPIQVALASPIPRALWPAKPGPNYLDAIPAALGVSELESAGAALPIYGEWYLMGGLPGVFLIGLAVIFFLQYQYEQAVQTRKSAVAAAVSCFCAFAYTRGYLAQVLTAYVFIVLSATLGYRRWQAPPRTADQ